MNGLWLIGALLSQAPQIPPAATPLPQQVTPAVPQLPVLTLDQALQQASQKNYELKQAQARLDQAHQAGAKAWSLYLPQVTVGGTYVRNSVQAAFSQPTGYSIRDTGSPTSGPANDPTQPTSPTNPPGSPTNLTLYPSGFEDVVIQKYNQFSAQAQLNQALIVPTLWTGIKAAYESEKVAELNTENARREILFAVAQSYYGAEGLKEAARVQHHLLDIDRVREHDAEVRYKAGTSPKIALLRAQIDLGNAEQDVKRADNAYLIAKSGLATLLGRDPDFDVEVPPEPATPSEGEQALEQTALKERPDVQAARAALQLAQTQRTGDWLAYLPTLGGSAQYRWSNSAGFTGSSTSWAIILALNWTIWDGGLREANLRESAARIVERQAGLEGLEATSRDEVRQALLQLDSAQANRVKAAETLKLARENLNLVHASVEAGVGTYLDEEDATGELISAELSLVRETLSASLSVLRVARAAGTFQASPPQH